MVDHDSPDCPLCMDIFELDDIHFYPCSCGYQICRFCWHRIRTDGNGLCPACRKAYGEDPAMYEPLSQEEIQKIKKERKLKEAQHKQKISDNRKHLSNIRVIQRHLVFVVGLSNKMADPEVLKRPEYLGKYGKILKIVINPNTNYAGPQGPSASAYITYTKEDDALKAIISINNMQPPLKIRASLGTTKYCTHYLRNIQCSKTDCMYLHDVGDSAASFTKEDMQAGKHQLFEKNLIEKYLISHPKQFAHLRQEISEEDEENEEVESRGSVPEDWGDELDNTESLLPSQASWGSREENRPPIAITVNNEINKLETITNNDVSKNIDEEFPEILSSTSRTKTDNIPIPENNTVPSKNRERISPNAVANSPSVSSSLTSNSSCHDDNHFKSDFSTGWSTSCDSVLSNPVVSCSATTSTTTESTVSYTWPSISDLGLSDLKINPLDDDLGFDPFSESKTALEDLIAKEKQQSNMKVPATTQPSFNWDTFWPPTYNNRQNQMQPVLSSYSLFGENSSVPQHQQQQLPQYRPPLMTQFPPNQQLHNMPPPGNLLPNQQSGMPFRFPSQPRFPAQMSNPPINSIQQQQGPPTQQFPGFFNQYRFQSPQNQLYHNQFQQSQQPSSVSGTAAQPTTAAPTENKTWQDGLRALLPHINISFSKNWNSSDGFDNSTATSQTSIISSCTSVTSPTTQLIASIAPQMIDQVKEITTSESNPTAAAVASPPPGFSFSGLANPFPVVAADSPPERRESWSTETIGPRPPPPPGFGKPSEGTFSLPSKPMISQQKPTPGIINVPISTNQTSNVTSSQTSSNKRPLSSSHEDPSILWSKVLVDQTSKDLEPTSFPLPGENTCSTENLSSNRVRPQPTSHMTSWNTIVSGNQSKVNKNTNQQPLTISPKENGEIKPQKPSPIFGNQQKLAVKKPTAHVKPLKCHPVDGGFTTVQSSRQGIVSSQPGSRISELDDFSTDLLIAPNNIAIQNVALDYGSVTISNNNKATQKKRRKKKDQSEQISEVIVGRVEASERPPSTLIQDERPIVVNTKKSSKNKKKVQPQKQSPPQQRKSSSSSPIPNKLEQSKSEQQQPIRILKSDGNITNMLVNAPIQASSDMENTSKTTASNNGGGGNFSHDHEIVSRLTESTEKLLKNVLFETEAIKLNTEQISKDLKSALEKCKESSLSLSDLEKINSLLTPVQIASGSLDDSDLVDTSDLERQVESARREAKMLEARLNDVIRKNMASELETLKRNTKGGEEASNTQNHRD